MKSLRQFLSLTLALVTLACAYPVYAVSNDVDPMSNYKLVYGDATLDGDVTTADVYSMLKYCSGNQHFNAMQCINGDVNCDSVVNTADVSLVLRHIVGLIKSLPYTPVNNQLEHSFSFKNNSFPKDNQRIAYGKSYTLNASITSEYALKMVRIKISDTRDGAVEIDKYVSFNSGEYVRQYNTQTSDKAIDSLIRFSELSTGKKKLELICSNQAETNVKLFESEFRVGFTYDEVAGHVYDKNDDASSTEARKILALLNSLNFSEDQGSRIIENGISRLGETYSTMDCSRFVQLTVKDSIGLSLPRSSVDQAIFCRDNGYLVDQKSMRTGDLIFMSRTYCDCGRYHEIHHVAIYIGSYDGTNYIIESTGSLNGVVIRRIWGLTGGNWIIDSVARVCD